MESMKAPLKLKQIVLALGDIVVFYAALALTLIVRYKEPFSEEALQIHLQPFSLVFIVWVLVFYIVGLYEIRALKTGVDFVKKFGAALVINALATITFFYFVPLYAITPKTNLFIFLTIVLLLEYFWRSSYNNFLVQGAPTTKVLFFGNSAAADGLINHLKKNPQLGYETVSEEAEKIDIIIVPAHLRKDSKIASAVYKNLVTGTEITDVATFYELIIGKVPLSELEEFWFLGNLINRHKSYDLLRGPFEMLLALVLAIAFSPLVIIAAALIKITSKGPILIKQVRTGELGNNFTLYKFRSMVANAETSGPQWSQNNDPRVTALGRILRRTHLDELPQLINIIRGNISFVGPRPERPEFVERLKKEIPFYELRHIVKPGLTGWAQLNYRYGASVEDAREKLQYDIYYLKNRSFWLDLSIIIKTIKLFFTKN